MATTEPTINDAIAGVLRETRHVWRDSSHIVSSENSGMLKGNQAQPDILVVEPNVSPVVIETEVIPAITVEVDALSRLGHHIRTNGRTILSSIAIRLPTRFRTKQGILLHKEIAIADDFEMALYTGCNSKKYSRWPRSGWIIGSIYDLSILIQSASIPPEIIDEAADQLVNGVTEVAGMLEEMAISHPGAIHQISEELHQEDGDQTRRMAATILANAFMFQESLASGPGELANVYSLEQLRGSSDGLTKSAILTEWRKILIVNYWPIFDIARRILEIIPTADSNLLIENLAITADKLLQNRLMRSHDLTGAVFQRLIADRKFLAAYYTTPASAALLAGLAITFDNPPSGGSWANAEDIKTLRIADFACGTGTLLSAAYLRVSQLHELSGGDSEKLHPEMIANSLIGCDVLPAAAHLTASMISGAHPTVKYEKSSILTVAYGRQPDGSIALGSLDLLSDQGKFDILSITAKAVEGMGEAERNTWRSLPHASFDLVIMNPPFTRATAHEGKKASVPNPVFAAFGSSAEEQKLMAIATERLIKGTSAHGNAGISSIFLVLADRMLKTNGVLAMVMPLSLIAGESWENSRALLAKNYSNLILMSIAGYGSSEMSFSADTGMGECLVVGKKSKTGSKRATFVVLKERPAYPLVGASTAQQICHLVESKNISRLEDGPIGGTQIFFGNDKIGQLLDSPLPTLTGWNLGRILDFSLAQSAYHIINKQRLWLPTLSKEDSKHIPITFISRIGEIGPIDRDINGFTPSGDIRGPFNIEKASSETAPTYPVLWAHNAEKERTILFDADCEGIPRRSPSSDTQILIDQKIAYIWETSSHCHFNRDFQFNSQSTGMQFTLRKTIGGRAWLSIKLTSINQEKALVLWANTSLGLLLHWWHTNKQQSGRGSVSKSALQNLPVLDVTTLNTDQLNEAVKIFDDIKGQPLLPVHEIDRDPIRKELDEKFARNVLGLENSFFISDGPLEKLRLKLSREPSIRGKK